MVIATKSDIMALCGPEPLTETLTLPATELQVTITGIVRSHSRAAVYREIENMTGLHDVTVDGERVPITEDDIVAACWAEACVRQPRLTALEWLLVGARDADLLALIGTRCLVCSRLMKGDNVENGVDAAALELSETRDPFGSSPSGSVSNGSEGFLRRSTDQDGAPANGSTKLTIV